MDPWYVVCEARAAGPGPCPIELFGRPFVVWRDRGGRPSLLVDRCPHRNAPLSMGRVTAAGLECAYHGWTFDAGGRCRADAGAEAIDCVEQDGLLWGCFGGGEAPAGLPPRPKLLEGRGAGLVRERLTFEAPLAEVAENVLDVPHTRFLHGGLFRRPGDAPAAEVVVRRTPTEVEAEYRGEPRPAGWIGRILAPRGGQVSHHDRFRLPAVTEVEYRLGETSALVATSFLTPESANRTRLHAFVAYRTPLPRWLLRLVAAPLLGHVARQDAAMLARQTANIARFGGPRFHSTPEDVLGVHIRELLRGFADDLSLRRPVGPCRAC